MTGDAIRFAARKKATNLALRSTAFAAGNLARSSSPLSTRDECVVVHGSVFPFCRQQSASRCTLSPISISGSWPWLITVTVTALEDIQEEA